MNEFLRRTIKLYVWTGSWPINGAPRLIENLRYAAGLLIIISIAIMNGFQYFDLYMHWGNWKHFAEKAYLFFAYTCVIGETFVFYSRREEIMSLSEEITNYENEIFSEKNDSEKVELLRDGQRKSKFINTFLWLFMFMIIVYMVTWPMIYMIIVGDYDSRILPIPVQYPFSLNSTENYAAVYLSDAMTEFLVTTHSLAFDSLFVAYIFFALARLKILRHSIEQLPLTAQRKLMILVKNRDDFIVTPVTRKTLEMIFQDELKKCIQEHQRIITFCKTVDSLLSPVLFGVFITYSMIICLLLFHLLMTGMSTDLLQPGQILMFSLLTLFRYYWCGDELTNEGLKIGESVLGINWYDFGKSNAKTIISMVLRSQKPIYLTVGKFYMVTLETYLSLLSSAYSYFALMKQFM
ncbi:odorant receptor Or2-like isoform X1 [Neodiprion pinetum]|uniref:odorant receptor Or2-like isoform X1 n=1 Tax=Neodiprion pinetum TaxID=441929 RepID=UPI001EDF35F7|nr:odorant receptor Or2-like isoform X1 [Neodiprion pinetum]